MRNSSIVEGDPLTLVDTGQKTDVGREAPEAGVASLGRRMEVIERVIDAAAQQQLNRPFYVQAQMHASRVKRLRR